MKLKIFALGLVLCLSAYAAPGFAFPDPVNYVSDFANIISADGEARINSLLHDHEKQTSIQIFIVTTPGLDGMAIEEWTMKLIESNPKWRAGQKGKDNGIIIAVAPNERRYRVEVGYGLEGDLPDVLASRLAEKYFVPDAKEGNFAAGTEKLALGIIKTLGSFTAAEREAMRAQKAEERRKAEEKQKAVISTLLFIAAIVVAIIILTLIFVVVVKIIREVRRKEHVRKKVKTEAANHLQSINGLKVRVKENEIKSGQYPDFAKIESAVLLVDAEKRLEAAANDYESIVARTKEDPDAAASMLYELADNLRNAASSVGKAEALPEKIKKFEKQASEDLAAALRKAAMVTGMIDTAAQAGFRFDVFSDRLKEQRQKLADLEKDIARGGRQYLHLRGYDICRSADKISGAVILIAVELKTVIDARNYVRDHLQDVSAEIDALKTAGTRKYGRMLEELKAKNPESSWSDIQRSFGTITALAGEGEKLVSSAAAYNTMEAQKFSEARTQLKEAEKRITVIKAAFTEVAERKKAIEEARTSYADKAGTTAADVSRAARKVRESNVGSKAKKLAAEAEQILDGAQKTAASGGLINWIAVVLLLTTAGTLAAKAFKSAQSDIDAARRKREEEEEEERRRRRRRNSSSSSSFGGGSFSGGGSSFSGGGGGFGGGGASGSF